MTQLNLPLGNRVLDRGEQNALKNIIATVSDEFRKKESIVQGILGFTIYDLPRILRKHTPLEILSSDNDDPEKVSPYDFEIFDLIKDRKKINTLSKMIEQLDISELASPLRGAELIGIDESLVDTPLPHINLTFLKSVAFRIHSLPDGTINEAIGPVMSELRMQRGEGSVFELENKLLSYIRNNFIAYISALTSLAFRRKPFIVLHGPLIYNIAPYTLTVSFDYETAEKLLSIDLADSGEIAMPERFEEIAGDKQTNYNLPLDIREARIGLKNLEKFNHFCIQHCGRKCETAKLYNFSPCFPPKKVTKSAIENRYYPGFCLYFWMLRSLFDLSRLSKITITSVIENISRSVEMSRLLLPSLLAKPEARLQIEQSALKVPLQEAKIKYSPESRRSDLYNETLDTIDKLRFSDSTIFSYVLKEGQYTSPVQIYRYRTQGTLDKAFGRPLSRTSEDKGEQINNILEKIFPSEPRKDHPGYRILMSYVRTTPLREPVRVEFFDLGLPKSGILTKIIGPIFLLSLPYQEYGMPIILYYADKLARTPTKLIQSIIDREYLEIILQNRISEPVSIMQVFGRLMRNFFQRDGLK